MTKRKALTITSVVTILFASAAFGGADDSTQQGWDEGYKYWLDAGPAPQTKQPQTSIQDRYRVFYVDRETGAMLDGEVAALDDVDAKLPLALVQNGNDVFYVDMQAGTTTTAGAIWDGYAADAAGVDAAPQRQARAGDLDRTGAWDEGYSYWLDGGPVGAANDLRNNVIRVSASQH
jgi:hypothetical protein